MPISTKDEITVKYADSIKEAADAVDYTNAIASSIAIDVGASAAIAAGAGLVSGTGAIAGIMGTVGSASGLASALAGFGLAGPVGWILGGILAAGSLAYTIYDVSKKTDDNLDDLIERLEALDTKTDADEAFIKDGWIKKLQSFKPVLALSQTTTDPIEKVKQTKAKLDGMSELVKYLKAMQQDWPSLQPRLTDWGFDIGQAKAALDKTEATIDQGMKQAQVVAKEESKKLIEQLEKEKGQSYRLIAQKIVSMYDQLVQATGKVTFDNAAESAGFKLAQDLVSGNADITDINKNGFSMIRLQSLLEAATAKQSKQQRPMTKKQSLQPAISKRALTLGDGTKITPRGVEESGGMGRQPVAKKNNQVANLQNTINHLAAIYNPQAERISVDGIYGEQTSSALVFLLNKMPNLSGLVAKYAGLTTNAILDHEEMNSDAQSMDKLAKVLSAFLEQEVGQESAKQPEEEKRISNRSTGPGKCPIDKENCNTQEIEYCLMEMEVEDKTGPMRADKFLKMWGYNTPEERASVIRDALGTTGAGLPAPSSWKDWGSHLVNYVVKTNRGRQPGQGQFITR